MLTTGIPAYRLPREVVDREVQPTSGPRRRGARTAARQDAEAARASSRASYDAVILATGLQKLRAALKARRAADCRAVEQGIRFLHRVNLEGGGRLVRPRGRPGRWATRRWTARAPPLRAGAERVTLAYRRTRAEMPAIATRSRRPLAEGSRAPAPAPADRPARRGDVDRRRSSWPRSSWASRTKRGVGGRWCWSSTDAPLACDRVLLALGQSADLSFLPGGLEARGRRGVTRRRALNVVAAGDVATGDGTVTHAIGRRPPRRRVRLNAAGRRGSRCSSAPTAAMRCRSRTSGSTTSAAIAPARDRLDRPERSGARARFERGQPRPRPARSRPTAASPAASARAATPASCTARRASCAVAPKVATRSTTPTARAAGSASRSARAARWR